MITVKKTAAGKFQQIVEAGRHSITADATLKGGGDEAGFEPHELLDAALGACTAITLHMVAQRKQMPLEDVRIKIDHVEDDTHYRMSREIELVGDLTPEQRDYLLGIANKCPVHRSLTKQIEIATTLKG